MAIDADCPHCHKNYRLKDDLLGKNVTCANAACRKVFIVEPSKNGKPPAPKPAAAPPPPPVDAETLAAAALADEGEAVPVDDRTVAMTCTACDHKWTVPWASIGKNVLCPECRHRHKVPEQKAGKKVDWRDGSGRPSLARVEELAGVQASTNARIVSGDTLLKTGVIGVQYEALPTSFYVKWGLGIAAFLAVIVTGIVYKVNSVGQGRQENLIADVQKQIDSEEIKLLPPAVAPLFRASLYMAVGEHEARAGDQKHVESAATHYNQARKELADAPRSGDRDALLAELTVLVLSLGGTEQEVKERKKLPWEPVVSKPGRAQVKPNQGEAEGVQGHLRRSFEAMRTAGVEFEFRAAAARRAARVLVPHGQTTMLISTLPAGFLPEEQPEVTGQIGLEMLRAGDQGGAATVALGLVGNANAAASPAPTSVQALWLATATPSTPTLVGAPGSGNPSNDARLAYTALYMVQNKAAEAIELANRLGPAESRLRALALGAEYADKPGPFIEAALEVVNVALKDPNARLPANPVLVRLAADAGRAGNPTAAARFVEVTTDEGLKEWGRAEVLRQQWAADRGQEAKEDDAKLPTDPKLARIGQVLARQYMARHNAARTGNRDLAKKYAAAWSAGVIAPFGQAGVALGVQDADLQK